MPANFAFYQVALSYPYFSLVYVGSSLFCVNLFLLSYQQIVERCHNCLNWPFIGISRAPINTLSWLHFYSLIIAYFIESCGHTDQHYEIVLLTVTVLTDDLPIVDISMGVG